MSWMEVLDQMQPCVQCAKPFYKLRYPQLIPCGHVICCDSCIAQSHSVQCPSCCGVFQSVVGEPFFEHLMKFVSSFLCDEGMAEQEKEAHAQKVCKELNEYFARKDRVMTSHSDSHEESSMPDKLREPALLDLDEVPFVSVFETIGETWNCAICGNSDILSTEFRCGQCGRANFTVYGKVMGLSKVPPSSQEISIAEHGNEESGEGSIVPPAGLQSASSVPEQVDAPSFSICDKEPASSPAPSTDPPVIHDQEPQSTAESSKQAAPEQLEPVATELLHPQDSAEHRSPPQAPEEPYRPAPPQGPEEEYPPAPPQEPEGTDQSPEEPAKDGQHMRPQEYSEPPQAPAQWAPASEEGTQIEVCTERAPEQSAEESLQAGSWNCQACRHPNTSSENSCAICGLSQSQVAEEAEAEKEEARQEFVEAQKQGEDPTAARGMEVESARAADRENAKPAAEEPIAATVSLEEVKHENPDDTEQKESEEAKEKGTEQATEESIEVEARLKVEEVKQEESEPVIEALARDDTELKRSEAAEETGVEQVTEESAVLAAIPETVEEVKRSEPEQVVRELIEGEIEPTASEAVEGEGTEEVLEEPISKEEESGEPEEAKQEGSEEVFEESSRGDIEARSGEENEAVPVTEELVVDLKMKGKEAVVKEETLEEIEEEVASESKLAGDEEHEELMEEAEPLLGDYVPSFEALAPKVSKLLGEEEKVSQSDGTVRDTAEKPADPQGREAEKHEQLERAAQGESSSKAPLIQKAEQHQQQPDSPTKQLSKQEELAPQDGVDKPSKEKRECCASCIIA